MENFNIVAKTMQEKPSLQALKNDAFDLFITMQKPSYEVVDILMQKGATIDEATMIVNELENKFGKAHRNEAIKQMAIGGGICLLGLILTIAKTGFIFYGAIIFGAIKFFTGLYNLSK
jgi:hypothetical protein